MIKKFELTTWAHTHEVLYTPPGARFLSAAFQGNRLVVWVDDPDTHPARGWATPDPTPAPGPRSTVEVVTRFTGDDSPGEGFRYVATAMSSEGLVVHVFVKGEES